MLGFKIPGVNLLATMLVVAPAAVLVTAQESLSEPAAEECISHPTSAAPRGAHWYYRVNRAKQHCWYLGKADKHGSARNVASDGTATAAPAPAAAATPASAPAPAPADENGDQAVTGAAPLSAAVPATVVPAPGALAPSAPVPGESVAAASAAVPASIMQTSPVFNTRWPSNLPNAEDASETEPGSASSTSTDARGTTAEAATPIPATSPRGEAEPEQDTPTGDTALRYLSIAGMLAIPLVLAVGWGARYARRRPEPMQAADLWREFAKRQREHPDGSADSNDLAEFDRIANISDRDQLADVSDLDQFAEELAAAERLAHKTAPEEMPADAWRGEADVRAQTPTVPSDDLRASLVELMRDLRKAGAFAPAGEAERSARQADKDQDFPILQAAE